MSTQTIEQMISERLQAKLDERINAEVERRLEELFAGTRTIKGHKSKSGFTIHYPPSSVLRRGDAEAFSRINPDRLTGKMTILAWNSLAKGGQFANRATRADMTRYLLSAFDGATQNQVSAAISSAIKTGLLIAEAPKNA